MQFVDITKDNWSDVLFLTTNETITVTGSGAPYADPDHLRGKHVYEKAGFRSEHEMLDDEELYKYVFSED